MPDLPMLNTPFSRDSPCLALKTSIRSPLARRSLSVVSLESRDVQNMESRPYHQSFNEPHQLLIVTGWTSVNQRDIINNFCP